MRRNYLFSIQAKRRFWYPKIYRLTVLWQTLLWKCGIPWHNSFSDECTPDFNCCTRKP